ncbi:hypothetical protein KUTeg_009132 [Tegillarca granosa]|uniref:Uncharacterized protein n=1 Tax=Tegillarca granosa TaxID=220873 RepID=A0ABQ9FAU1_TEGGR|nr:hypothetical protein KUTeg_009132 [Tegillarca granosa]
MAKDLTLFLRKQYVLRESTVIETKVNIKKTFLNNEKLKPAFKSLEKKLCEHVTEWISHFSTTMKYFIHQQNMLLLYYLYNFLCIITYLSKNKLLQRMSDFTRFYVSFCNSYFDISLFLVQFCQLSYKGHSLFKFVLEHVIAIGRKYVRLTFKIKHEEIFF